MFALLQTIKERLGEIGFGLLQPARQVLGALSTDSMDQPRFKQRVAESRLQDGRTEKKAIGETFADGEEANFVEHSLFLIG